MAVASPERLRSDLLRLVHRGAGVRDFSLGAARILARAVPFDGVCMLTIDPATLLPTGEVVDNGLPEAATARMTEIELRGEDFSDEADAQTAVITEPVRPHELAPLVADAHELTERERAVTQLVARGLQTSAIADRLHLSPWTVQDHLK